MSSTTKHHHTTVSIPEPLYEKTKKRLSGTGFTSVSSFVTFLLREYISWDDEDTEKPDTIREKLKKLGYL